MQVWRDVCWTRRREEEKKRGSNGEGSYAVDKGERDTSTATGGEVPIMREMIQGLPVSRQLRMASWFGYKRGNGRQAGCWYISGYHHGLGIGGCDTLWKTSK